MRCQRPHEGIRSLPILPGRNSRVRGKESQSSHFFPLRIFSSLALRCWFLAPQAGLARRGWRPVRGKEGKERKRASKKKVSRDL